MKTILIFQGSAITATCMGYGQNLNVPNFTTGELIKNLFKLIKRVFLN